MSNGVPQDPTLRAGTGFEVLEPMPRSVKTWELALGAHLREKFEGAVVGPCVPMGKGKSYQVRVMFGEPVPMEEADVMKGQMLEMASDLARRMRRLEEDTALNDIQEAEKRLSAAASLLQQASDGLSSGVKSASELATALDLGKQALSMLVKFLPPGTISTIFS